MIPVETPAWRASARSLHRACPLHLLLPAWRRQLSAPDRLHSQFGHFRHSILSVVYLLKRLLIGRSI